MSILFFILFVFNFIIGNNELAIIMLLQAIFFEMRSKNENNSKI